MWLNKRKSVCTRLVVIGITLHLILKCKENGDTDLIAIEIDTKDNRFWAWSENYVYFIVYWCPRWDDECERIIASVPLRSGVKIPCMINDES